MTVEFTDVSSETKIHNVVRKVDYFSLVNQEEPERNVSLLAVNPPFDFRWVLFLIKALTSVQVCAMIMDFSLKLSVQVRIIKLFCFEFL